MATEIKMPQLGESVTEGTVGRWLKQPGDAVAKYEPLLEVITDKVDSEVPAPLAGTLLEILVPEGETVRVGTVIARLGTAEETATAPVSASAAAAEATATPTPSAASSASASSTSSASASSTSSASATPPPTDAFVPPMASAVAEANNAPGAFLSPVVARLLAEHGLDQSAINGSGQGGRITKQDVLRHIAARSAQPATPSAQPATPSAQASALSPEPSALSPEPSALSPEPSALSPQPSALSPEPSALSPEPLALPEDTELVPLSPMRRAIAEHMERSVRTAPHVTTVVELDLSQVVAHRAAQQAAFARQDVRLTYTAYFAQAVATALGRVPVLNGSFSSEGIVLHRRVHLGIAVALDEGLIVPVVRDADEKNLLGLARAIGDLAARARTRRLQPEETQGGTFTITNHGVTGSLFATPIINQPQAGILGIGAIVKRPVVVSQNGSDAIAIRPICYLSLTFDHRITDGADADGFLAAIKQFLERYA